MLQINYDELDTIAAERVLTGTESLEEIKNFLGRLVKSVILALQKIANYALDFIAKFKDVVALSHKVVEKAKTSTLALYPATLECDYRRVVNVVDISDEAKIHPFAEGFSLLLDDVNPQGKATIQHYAVAKDGTRATLRICNAFLALRYNVGLAGLVDFTVKLLNATTKDLATMVSDSIAGMVPNNHMFDSLSNNIYKSHSKLFELVDYSLPAEYNESPVKCLQHLSEALAALVRGIKDERINKIAAFLGDKETVGDLILKDFGYIHKYATIQAGINWKQLGDRSKLIVDVLEKAKKFNHDNQALANIVGAAVELAASLSHLISAVTVLNRRQVTQFNALLDTVDGMLS